MKTIGFIGAGTILKRNNGEEIQGLTTAASLGIHVTAASSSHGPAPISDHPPPELPGDTTKEIITNRSTPSYREAQADTARMCLQTARKP